ncbi:Oidioi.mRNA.OKI2018_I69.PAR.g12696.t1.cds [Oikopleura dioica]|uniref:Oidioi.mRNA.OKI2018_I69.PAR.g12696.t1.cds n=1 Tax=Oikopleura dioica TaxID=34765 RepID=A0ABN7S869_OIKDI|nr:Oidioi.mRNA.OKI2018_I69.PAR.g12696.t1.cds [Oikopleura dioica]
MFTFPNYRRRRSPPRKDADTKSRNKTKSCSDDGADENRNPAIQGGRTAAIVHPKATPKQTKTSSKSNFTRRPGFDDLPVVIKPSSRRNSRRRRRVTPEAIRALLVGKSSQGQSQKSSQEEQKERSPSPPRNCIVRRASTVAGVHERRFRRELSPTSERYFGDMLDDAVAGVGPCISLGHVWTEKEQEEARRIRREEEAEKERAKNSKERAKRARENAKKAAASSDESLPEQFGQMGFQQSMVDGPKEPIPTPSAQVVVGGRRAPFELNWTDDCDAACPVDGKPKRWQLTLKDLQRIFATAVDTCDGIPASLADTRLGWYLQQLGKIAKVSDDVSEQRKQLRALLASLNRNSPRFICGYPSYGILEPSKPWHTLGSFYPVFAQDLFGRYIVRQLYVWAFFGDDDWRLINIDQSGVLGHISKLVDVINALGVKTVFPWPSKETTSFAAYKAMFLLAAGFIPTTMKQPYALEASMANEQTFKILCLGDEIKQPPCAKQLRAIERSLELRIWRSVPECMNAVYHLEAKKQHATDSSEELWTLTFGELQKRLNRSIGINALSRQRNLTKAQVGELALIRAMDAVYDALPPIFTNFKFGVTDELVAMFLFGNTILPPTEDPNFLHLFGVVDPITAGLADFYMRGEVRCEDYIAAVDSAKKTREAVLDELFQNMLDMDVFGIKENDLIDTNVRNAGPDEDSSLSSEAERRRDLAVIEPFSTSMSSSATQARGEKKKKDKKADKNGPRSSFGASQLGAQTLDTVSESSFPTCDPFKEAVISLVSSDSSSSESDAG